LRSAHITVSDHDWDPRRNPKQNWSDDDIAYLTIENRLRAVTFVRDALSKEMKIAWDKKKPILTLATTRLKTLLLAALECDEDIDCPFEIEDVEELSIKKSRFLGPIRVPPPIQVLQLQENRLKEVMDDEKLSINEREVASNQYHTMWQLKAFLICELFTTEEDLLNSDETMRFILGQSWYLWIVFD
jgi:hypothetical protein